MRACLALALLLTACGSSAVSPSPQPSPSPAPAPSPGPPPVPAKVTITATLTATVGGGSAGTFTTEVDRLPALVSVAAPGYLTRQAYLGSATPTVDLISIGAPFDMAFYQKFVRDALDEPGTLQPWRRQPADLHVYIRTVDETGAGIDGGTLSTTEAAIRSVAPGFTGGRFGVASVESGTGSREGQPGWITVKWGARTDACGVTNVGSGAMELDIALSSCGCSGSRIRARTVKHEFGHAMGFYHTGDSNDLMSGLSVSVCDQDPSARERYHAAVAYSRQNGNRDPDNDSSTSTPLAVRSPVIVVD